MKREDLSPLDDLLYMADSIRKAVDQQLAGEGLTYTHFKIMRELIKLTKASPAKLASSLGLSRPGMKKALQALIADPDPRVESYTVGSAVVLTPTATGRQSYANMLQCVAHSSARVYWLPVREAHRLENLMRKARISREGVFEARAKARLSTAKTSLKKH